MLSQSLPETFASFQRPDGIMVAIEGEVLKSFADEELCCHVSCFQVITRNVGDFAEPVLVVLSKYNQTIVFE